ncbi:T9SS type A sorting domain-containing protein [Winogradskyella psychrotolerans]|uniref:T9SS type A sorting domain-containing protein n=1 Tax=Winogradskyella psychrotolerans TaxID=1344585 RepID=UPI001C06D278|nr:T9SS type A sorting domain-containing protein [Winogradskyella psychrotolerans]MBU2926828.1 T9SS type A sorting domain-containing protein [Winogradskyella psychrotolerans]
MNLKITFNLKPLNTLKMTVFALFLTASANIFGQTVTEAFPSRITTNSKITVLGTDFTESTSISINGININSSSITLLSDTEMLFAISHTGSSDVSGELVVGGVSTGINIDYISPSHKTLKNGETSNVTKITEIFTTYNGFWRSSQWKADPTNNSLKPNTSHDLLAFTYNGVTYSTGVDDQVLTDNGVTFSTQLFYAYTTNGVDGTTYGSNYLAMADLIDGEVNEGTAITSEEILGTTIYDVLIDGVNGLDIGTGVTNFNATADVEFYSAGGQLGALNDDVPDFLISQIAMAGSTDIYYYTDSEKNVVGRPVKLTILDETDTQGDALLTQWRLDLYNFTNGVNYGIATPQSRAFSNNEQRPLRMVALKFEDFQITDTNITDINNVNMVAGGTADLGFLAYNRGSFDIKTPVFTEYPAARYVCQLPSESSISFSATATVSGGATGAPEETLSYQWFKYSDPIPGATSSTYTLPNTIDSESLGIYKLKVSNSYGAVVVPVSLSLGGTPVYWNGTDWELPPVYQNAGVVVEPQDRGLVFSSNYNEVGDIEGCDCLVPSGSNVTIPSGSTLKLYGEVTVESGGSLTFEDSASLIQTKIVSSNENVGSIKVKRNVTDLHDNDYVLWSSPVAGFDVSNITSEYTTDAFNWGVNTANSNGISGDWALTTGAMNSGLGYAVNVPTELVTTGFTTTFVGTPNNGDISVDVYKSTGNQPNLEVRHRNLIGNPYPSAISAEQLLTDNTLLEGNVKIWSHNSAIPNATTPLTSSAYQALDYNYAEQYVSYNFTGANPPESTNGYIGSGQGFFVQVDDSASEGSVTFTNAMRSNDDDVAYDNSQFYRSEESTNNDLEKHLVWLSLIDATDVSASTLVGYVEGATMAKDRLFDAYSDDNSMRIYSIVDNAEMVIQGRSLPFVDTDVVPLGIELPESGIFKIAIGDLAGTVFAGGTQGIYLEDTVLNTEHDLIASPYSFSGVEGKINDRFNLRYTTTLSVDDVAMSNTFAYVKDGTLNVRSGSGIKDVKVYDINGRQVSSYASNGQDNTLSESFRFSKGVYLATITLEGNVTVTKKIIN